MSTFARLMAAAGYKPLSQREMDDYHASVRADVAIAEWRSLPWYVRLWEWMRL